MPVIKASYETEPKTVLVITDGAVSHVWLRKGVHEEQATVEGDGGVKSAPSWVADETYFKAPGMSMQEAEARFDELWAEHAAEEPTAAQMAQTIAEQDAAICELYEMMEAKEVDNG